MSVKFEGKSEAVSQSQHNSQQEKEHLKKVSQFLHNFDSSIKNDKNNKHFKRGSLTKREVTDCLDHLKQVIPNKSSKSIITILY